MKIARFDQPESTGTPRDSAWTARLRIRARPFVSALLMAPLFVGMYYFAYWLRSEGELTPRIQAFFTSTVGWVVAVKVAIFGGMRVGQGWRRSVTFDDVVTLGQASTLSLVVIAVLDRFLLSLPSIPRSVFFLDWCATLVVLGGARAALRGFRELSWAQFFSRDAVPVFIVGASDVGELVLRAIRKGSPACRVAGFLDENPELVGTRIGGVRVVGTLDQIEQLAEQEGVRQILVVREAISGGKLRKLMEQARQNGVEVRVLPSYEQLIDGRVTIQPRPVAIDDLLHREPVQLDLGNIRRWIDGRVLLVTGSAGSIGSEICRQLLQFSPQRLVLVDRSENGQFFLERELRALSDGVELDVCIADVLDPRRIGKLFARHRPHIVFHAAAYKHVPLMEAHPGEAVKNIILATRRLADTAIQSGVEAFVMISTDKAVNPTSVMGACKRVAELYVQSLADERSCRFVTVRFGNVLDSAGSVVPVFRQQIAAGGPVTVTHPRMQRYFMTIPEAARLVIQAGTIGNGGEILTLDMGEPVLIADLAEDMIRLSGLRVGEDVAIEYTGLRPGEKLVEQLHIPGEQQLPTCHPKIAVAGCRRADREELLQALQRLERLVEEDPERIVAALKGIVREYRRMDERRAA